MERLNNQVKVIKVEAEGGATALACRGRCDPTCSRWYSVMSEGGACPRGPLGNSAAFSLG